MTIDEFIAKYSNQPVDFDGIYPNQCMDLMHQYIYDVLGITDRSVCAKPAAYQVFMEFNWSQYFDKIENTPDGVPQKGDIIFWGTSIGVSGHVAIFVDGNTDTFNSFDANWPLNSLCHLQNHNYTGVLGWLHPKTQGTQIHVPSDSPVITDQTIIDLGSYGKLEVQQIKGKMGDLATAQKQLEETQQNLQDVSKQLMDCQNKPRPSPTTVYSNPKTALGKLFESLAKSFG